MLVCDPGPDAALRLTMNLRWDEEYLPMDHDTRRGRHPVKTNLLGMIIIAANFYLIMVTKFFTCHRLKLSLGAE